MPKNNAVWGIDIGQSALKALRCSPVEGDRTKIAADAFDFIEYPKILSQPEADPALLVREALELFLSRNEVRGDRVAISVSGQSGLARFIKLPPVEAKKIPDIVKYEARQQIPFSLDDVVWDYQKLPGGSEDEGYALETEVGLFAMKRDQVFQALQPLDAVEIEVDFIQLAPLAIFNMIVFDQMQDLPPPDQFDPDNPPESVVMLSLGVDNTDLVVTNGYRVWQRSIPIGGSHFTRVLSKDLKLTFAKAEHLKRNASTAEDPKALFQAMRPVFNDLLTEVQRSIGFFKNLDRKANIGRVVALGSAMKLPGLQRYLVQNLGYPVEPIERYRGLTGGAVTAAPAFNENLLSFAVSYGLCLQGLEQTTLSTNLLPRELVTERVIREKKPWAVVAVAALLLGCTINFLGHFGAWHAAHPDRYPSAFAQATAAKGKSSQFTTEYEGAQETYQAIDQVGQNLVSNVEGRLLWLELFKAIDAALPVDAALAAGASGEPGNERPIGQRRELHLDTIDCEQFDNLNQWYQGIAEKYSRDHRSDIGPEGAIGAATAPNPDASAADAAPEQPNDTEAAEAAGPQGPGWVIQLAGYHYFNEDRNSEGGTFVRRTLLSKLENGEITLPAGSRGTPVPVSMKELGISYPVIVQSGRIEDVEIEKPEVARLDAAGTAGLRADAAVAEVPNEERTVKLRRFDFVVQFAWQPTPPSVRAERRMQQEDLAVPVDVARGSDESPLGGS